MLREYLSPEQLMEASEVPDNDPYRQSEAVRIYNRAKIGCRAILARLLDDEPSGLRSPSEVYRELDVYADILSGMMKGLEKEFKGLQLHKSLEGRDEGIIHKVDLNAMQIDGEALAYARKYLKIKDCPT